MDADLILGDDKGHIIQRGQHDGTGLQRRHLRQIFEIQTRSKWNWKEDRQWQYYYDEEELRSKFDGKVFPAHPWV